MGRTSSPRRSIVIFSQIWGTGKKGARPMVRQAKIRISQGSFVRNGVM
jgi:hypothetical protein